MRRLALSIARRLGLVTLGLVTLAACQQPQSASCREWVACSDALSERRGTIPNASDRWGPGASCWLTPSGAEECARECLEELGNARAMGSNLPLECNPITPEAPAPYDPLPPPGPCSAPRVLAGSAIGRPELAPLDFDGDGNLDFLVADALGGALQLYTGDGTGRFAATTSIFGRDAGDLHVADVDGDGRLDALVIETEQAILYAGQADGTFPYTSASDGFRGRGAAYADFDGDDLLDVFLPGMAIDGVALFGVGRGDGTFTTPERLLPGRQISGARQADLDEDGDLDVLTWFATETLGVAVNDGAGGFTFAAVPGSSLVLAHHIDVADLDGDGHDDVVLAGPQVISGEAPIVLAISFGDGTGALSGEQVFPLGALTTLVRAEDLDDDGRADVVVGDGSGLLVRHVAADRSVSDALPTAVTMPVGDYFRADVDGDADPDFVTTAPTGTTGWAAVTIYFACRS